MCIWLVYLVQFYIEGSIILSNGGFRLFLVPQPCDRLAAIHLDLCKTFFSLLYNCQLLCF